MSLHCARTKGSHAGLHIPYKSRNKMRKQAMRCANRHTQSVPHSQPTSGCVPPGSTGPQHPGRADATHMCQAPAISCGTVSVVQRLRMLNALCVANSVVQCGGWWDSPVACRRGYGASILP